jgi:hypothetical protein
MGWHKAGRPASELLLNSQVTILFKTIGQALDSSTHVVERVP